MTRYHPILVVLHWLLALMVLGALIGGAFSLDPIPEDSPDKIGVLRLHMIFGLSILALMVVRLVVRLRTPHPAPADIGNEALNQVAPWLHWMFYALVFGLAASGILMSVEAGLGDIVFGGAPGPVPELDTLRPRAGHGLLALALALLIAGHIGAAIYHQAVRRDGIMRRMGFGRG
ncbi:cytochrome b [Rhodosalinus sp.]|uniref:cytochrome b n=1 Tax=Rhodosalinus sp. TaxID=2047741 RepID=UPI00397C1C5D